MVCMGHDGHLGLGNGLGGSAASACPCAHDDSSEGLEFAVAGDPNDDRHPPCDDLTLDPPEVVKDAEFGQRLAQVFGSQAPLEVPTAWLPAWQLGAAVSDGPDAALLHWPSAVRGSARLQLEHQRVVVLLI
jgi:hypothetical protein